MTLRIPQLPADPDAPFPPLEQALADPDGLLAFGGDLSPTRFLNAYRGGIFPWFSEGEPILWWSPSRRAVFRTDGVRLPSRLRRKLRGSGWVVRADTAFAQVVAGCAAPRAGQSGGTWITADMQAAYNALHALGHAHSIEVFDGARLVGGIYGVAVGRMFFGESMFSAESGGSKVALAGLARILSDWGWPLIDAQLDNPHLRRLGAESWPRARFLAQSGLQVAAPGREGRWSTAFGVLEAAELGARSGAG